MALIKAVFLTVVLLWYAGDMSLVNGGFTSHYSHFEDVLMDNFMDWIPLAGLAFQYGAPEAHQTVTEYLRELHEKCQEDRYCKATSGILDYLYQLYKKYEEHGNKWGARKTIKSIIVKVVPHLIARFGSKVALNILLKTASHPLGYAADGAQILLELFGYEMAGKFVGAGGNIIAGGLAGFAVGGPPGAFLGGVMGFGLWGIGEFGYYEHAKDLETFVNDIID